MICTTTIKLCTIGSLDWFDGVPKAGVICYMLGVALQLSLGPVHCRLVICGPLSAPFLTVWTSSPYKLSPLVVPMTMIRCVYVNVTRKGPMCAYFVSFIAPTCRWLVELARRGTVGIFDCSIMLGLARLSLPVSEHTSN